jgi:HSP20 family molecular chaperone IbpA
VPLRAGDEVPKRDLPRSLQEVRDVMARLSLFNSPLLLGFDHIERVLDSVAKSSSDGYPPYNIEQTGENSLRITLAVAGFARDDLNVSVEDNQLIIRGRQGEPEAGRVFLHRGIAARQFHRRFVMAEGIEVVGATTENGLLHIDLQRPEPTVRTRTVEIRSGDTDAKRPATLDVAGQRVRS